jgi:type IV pilus assembly protein PilC
MPSFAYVVRSAAGQTEKGILDALDAGAASATLRAAGNVVLRLEPSARPAGGGGINLRLNHLPFVRPKMATFEVALRQVSVMLNSGLTLLEALRTTAEQSPPIMRATLVEIAERVQEGQTLAQAVAPYPWMGRMVQQLVDVGEQTGTLDVVLMRGADGLERQRLLTSQAVAALMYPTIVLIAAVAVTGFMVIYAIPELSKYLSMLGRPLPPMAQRLVDISDFLLAWWPVLTGGTVLAVIVYAVARATPPGRLLIDAIMLRLPLIGYILRTSATASFSRSFALLISSGVTIIEALRTCQELFRNRRLSVLIAKARAGVIAGEALAPGFKAGGTFMPMLGSMLAIGERTGNLDQTMTACADFHEQRLEALIKVLSSVVEVVVIIFVGGIVGYVYIAFMMALYGGA